MMLRSLRSLRSRLTLTRLWAASALAIPAALVFLVGPASASRVWEGGLLTLLAPLLPTLALLALLLQLLNPLLVPLTRSSRSQRWNARAYKQELSRHLLLSFFALLAAMLTLASVPSLLLGLAAALTTTLAASCLLSLGPGRAPISQALPGEIWWAEVPFAEGEGSKDRPCLVVALDQASATARVRKITSVDQSSRPGYVAIETQGWDASVATSWLQIDTLIDLPLAHLRRRAGRAPETARPWW